MKIKRSVEPKFEAAEKRRVMSLPKPARDKEAGDKCYKLADFEGAIEAYTRCIDATADKSSELLYNEKNEEFDGIDLDRKSVV